MISRRHALACMFLAMVVTTARAESGRWYGSEYDGHRAERSSTHDYGDSLDDVVTGLRRHNEGRVLSADTVREEGRPVHRIRIINEQGQVRGLRFDGDTGRPLSHYDHYYPQRYRH